jgi:hypothetical protein
MTTIVASTETSLPVQPTSGTSLQPSERAAALRAIPTEVGCSPDAVTALCGLVMGFAQQTLSEDSFALAVYEGERIAKQAGVSREEWRRVGRVVLNYWKRERAKNPLAGMF